MLLKRNLLFVFLLPLWLLKVRAHLKHAIAARVAIDAGFVAVPGYFPGAVLQDGGPR